MGTIVGAIAMPAVCVALGFWVTAVRIRDRAAWLLLAVLLSLPAFIGGGSGYQGMFGRDNVLQPLFTGFHQFFANIGSSALMLFGVAFPEPLPLDRRFPWLKWIVIGPLILYVVPGAVNAGRAVHQVALAQQVMRAVDLLPDWIFNLHLAEREKHRRELEIAHEVQERLFPQEYPAVAGLEYGGACRPALGVGGDYHDFILLSNTELGIAIGDISGKGMPAALLMATLRAYLRGLTSTRQIAMTDVMVRLNRLVFDSSPSNRYATFFYAEFDSSARVMKHDDMTLIVVRAV